MNIEQIADDVSKEMLGNVATLQPELVKWNREYLSRCLSKLAEQDVEPVARLLHQIDDNLNKTAARTYEELSENIYPDSWLEGEKLYTETQLLAAQQRTAEACEKACENITKKYDMDEVYAEFFSELVRNNWREYL